MDIRQKFHLHLKNSLHSCQTFSSRGRDKVQAGQVLATLNTNALQIQAKQAQAQLKAQQEAIVKQEVGARPEEINFKQKPQLASAQLFELDKTNKNLQRLQILVVVPDGRAISHQEPRLCQK